jgi:hypothetical protein
VKETEISVRKRQSNIQTKRIEQSGTILFGNHQAEISIRQWRSTNPTMEPESEEERDVALPQRLDRDEGVPLGGQEVMFVCCCCDMESTEASV